MGTHSVRASLPDEIVQKSTPEAISAGCGGSLPEQELVGLQRQRLQRFFSNTEPVWKDEDHPELVELGTYGWVRSLRENHWRSPEAEDIPAEQH